MAAIVKANPSLTAGGLAVLKRAYSTSDDGVFNYDIEYVCLSPFAKNHINKFRTNSNPPTPIPASVSLLPLANTPKLYDVAVKENNGLTYFNARYSAASTDTSQVTITESQEQRTFSANVRGSIRTAGNLDSTITVTQQVDVSFDYISITQTAEARSASILPEIVGKVGKPFNIKIGTINTTPAYIIGTYKESTVDQQSSTKTSRGLYTYTKSSSGIYVAVT